MAKEYIEREAAIALANGGCHPANVAKEIAKLPAADVRPVVRGRWIEDESGYQTCSNCGEEHHWLDYRADFCEVCGADMREEVADNG